MRALINTFAAMALLLVFGCSTPYKSNGLMGGFSETQLDENVFRVSFRGNGFTNPERAADLSLLRAAELARNNGYSYFIIVDSQSYSKYSAVTTPTTTTTTAQINTVGTGNISGNNVNFNANSIGSATTHTYGGQTFIISKPTTTNTIVCFKEKPEINGLIYKVDFLMQSLTQKYGIEIK